MQDLLKSSPDYDYRMQRVGVNDHFMDGYVDGGKWTKIVTGSGAAVANADGPDGKVTLTTGGTLNNECYLHTTKNNFLFAQNKPLEASCLLNWTDANVNTAAVAFGLMSAVATGAIVNGGNAGLVASYSGVSFFKQSGDSYWRAECSIGTTRTGPKNSSSSILLDANGTLLNVPAQTPPNGTQQELKIQITPRSATNARADFFINGVQVQSIDFVFTSALNMMLWVGIKAGDANSQVLTLDFLGCEQKF